jgi:hypothetical protein
MLGERKFASHTLSHARQFGSQPAPNYMTWPQSRDVGGQLLAGNAGASPGVRG